MTATAAANSGLIKEMNFSNAQFKSSKHKKKQPIIS